MQAPAWALLKLGPRTLRSFLTTTSTCCSENVSGWFRSEAGRRKGETGNDHDEGSGRLNSRYGRSRTMQPDVSRGRPAGAATRAGAGHGIRCRTTHAQLAGPGLWFAPGQSSPLQIETTVHRPRR